MNGLLSSQQPERFERRLRRVPISNDFLTRLLRGKFIHHVRDIVTNLPQDAEVLHVVADHERDCIVAIVRSAEFDPVDHGCVIPDWSPTYTVCAS